MMSASVLWKPDYFTGESRVIREVTNGWVLTATLSLTANSGQPFTVTHRPGYNYFDGQGNNCSSFVPGSNPRTLKSKSRVANENEWFDTTAYCIAGTTTGSVTCPGAGPLESART